MTTPHEETNEPCDCDIGTISLQVKACHIRLIVQQLWDIPVVLNMNVQRRPQGCSEETPPHEETNEEEEDMNLSQIKLIKMEQNRHKKALLDIYKELQTLETRMDDLLTPPLEMS